VRAERQPGERAQEIVDKWSGQGAIHAVLGADELARLRHYIAAALTATHEAARREGERALEERVAEAHDYQACRACSL
jgi:hypothetical protein